MSKDFLQKLSRTLTLLEDYQTTVDTLDGLLKRVDVAADLIGGVAVIYYGYVRNTGDIDILINRDDYGKVADAIVEAGGHTLGKNNKFELGQYVVQICYDGLKVRDTVFRKPESTKSGLNIVSLPSLLRMKVEGGMNQSRHRSDVIELIKRSKISKEYLDTEVIPLLTKTQCDLLNALYTKATIESQE